MSESGCSLLSYVLEDDRDFSMQDYAGPVARWCPGCGDHAVLAAVERLLEAEQLPPEKTVFVSGIGCSSRFPHYLSTYGFHGLHGRALPVATGVKLRRPDLHVFAVMGDGDCCSIGAGHWIHAIRYNVNMVALMLDNEVYGLTKNQTSPTTPQGFATNTQPRGSYLAALNPIAATLGVTNASFVAQTADWVPPHMFATIRAAFHHPGFAFVRVLQRCPQYTASLFSEAARNPNLTELLVHESGSAASEIENLYKHQIRHDPNDLDRARQLGEDGEKLRLGLFYRNESRPRYDDLRQVLGCSPDERIQLLNAELDRYAV